MSAYVTIMAIVAASVPVVLARPVGPPPPSAIEGMMRRECISEPGVAIIVKAYVDLNAPDQLEARRQKMRIINDERRAAAATVPLDIDRVTRAAKARAANGAAMLAHEADVDALILRQLSPQDRSLYARMKARDPGVRSTPADCSSPKQG